MSSVAQIKSAVYRAIDAVNDLLPPEQALLADDGSTLLGEGAGLDSMGFVNFIVTLEQELELELDKAINIADLLSVQSDSASRLRTVSDLIEVLSKRLE